MATYDIIHFGLREMTDCGADLRRMGNGVGSMEEVASRTVRYFYEDFIDGKTREKAFALVRLFKTHPWDQLDPSLRKFAQRLVDSTQGLHGTPCLTLLATIGDRAEWSARERSAGHQAIPLISERAVAMAPMIATLIRQMGLEVQTILKPDPRLLLDLGQRTFNVFHVPEAAGSPYIPAQREFVHPCGVKSVLGFGGMLPLGSFFAMVLFSKRPISRC